MHSVESCDTVTAIVLEPLLSFLLVPAQKDPTCVASLRAWRRATESVRAAWSAPIDRAIACASTADRVAFAFASGYEAALEALVPDLRGTVAALCATEQGGAHPRSIRATLVPKGSGAYELSGHKRWATMAGDADVLVVIASAGAFPEGRNRLRVARIDARAAGVEVRPMPLTPFAPEIVHAEVELANVRVTEAQLLPGDGYDAYLKPFRTIEDLFVHAALLAYLVGVARRHAFPQPMIERLVALLVATRTLAHEDPSATSTHIALAGVLDLAASLLGELESHWQRSADDEWTRWERDRGLLGVAANARAARRARAWTALAT